jgi:uncharacterized membrane protein YraQ (UPF0718 family)
VEDNVKDFLLYFTSIVYEALPFIVLGALIAGVLEELLPQQWITRFIPSNPTLAVLTCGFLGLIFPMCECGIVPIMRRLLRKGLPLWCCTCYMLSGPIINPLVLGTTLVAFSGMEDNLTRTASGAIRQLGGLEMTALRAGLGYLTAVGASLAIVRLWRKHGNDLLVPAALPSPDAPADDAPHNNGGKKRSLAQRLGKISEVALHDFVDITVFLILGALLASYLRMSLSHQEIQDFAIGHPYGSILVMMGLSVLLCLCSEADAFVAASFVTLPPASKLAFLVLGPMLDIKLYMLFTRVFRQRLIWTMIAFVVVQVFAYTSLVHFAWENLDFLRVAGESPR